MPDFRFNDPLTVFASIGGISLDFTGKVQESFPVEVTENRVEGSASVTDHIINLPTRLSIEGEFTDTPLTKLVGSYAGYKGLSKTKSDLLLQLRDEKEAFNVMDGLHLFEDMVFSNLTLLKDDSAYSVKISAELRQIIKVKSGLQNILDLANSATTRLQYLIQVTESVGVFSTVDLSSSGILA